MARKKKADIEAEYVSSSTIDREPREPKAAPKQEDLIDLDEHDAAVDEFIEAHGPSEFEVAVTVTLKGSLKHSIVVPLGAIPAPAVHELILKRLQSAYFKQCLQGIAGRQEATETRPQQESLDKAITKAEKYIAKEESRRAVLEGPDSELDDALAAAKEATFDELF